MIKFLKEITLLRTRGARQKSTSFGNELLKIYRIEGNMPVSKIQKSAKSLHPSGGVCECVWIIGGTLIKPFLQYVPHHVSPNQLL